MPKVLTGQPCTRDTSACGWGGQFTLLTPPEGLSTAAAPESSISSFANNFDTLLLVSVRPGEKGFGDVNLNILYTFPVSALSREHESLDLLSMDIWLWMRLQLFLLSAGAAPGCSSLYADLQQVIVLMEARYLQDLDYDKPPAI